MAKRKSDRQRLAELDEFLTPKLLAEIGVLSEELQQMRRRKVPLKGRDKERAKLLLVVLKNLADPLAEIKASLISGLPPEKWAGVGAGD